MTAMRRIVIVGGGPAGLMAAEAASAATDVEVDVFDAMPSFGRKFLMAGKGGMNITHAEPFDDFCARYGAATQAMRALLESFGPSQVRAWMDGLGIASFVGTSRRVFPVDMKAAPLLRAWLHCLRAAGVRLHARHRWVDMVAAADGRWRLTFASPPGERTLTADAVVLALGGGSWPQLGSDGAWTSMLGGLGVDVVPLRPANCGFDVGWSAHLRERFAGQAVKPVAASPTPLPHLPPAGTSFRRGEFVVTEHGVEGSLIYAYSAVLRETIEHDGSAVLYLDLLPDRSREQVTAAVAWPRGSRSLSSHLQSRLGLHGVKMALLRECLTPAQLADTVCLSDAIKCLPLRLQAPRPLAEAISSAGGVAFSALDECLMLRRLPGVFCAGEMLDWEAPTGGYLLTACLSGGRAAGQNARLWCDLPRSLR